MNEVRTPKGKMVGTFDARTGTLRIKNGKRTTVIEVPKTGLNIRFASDGSAFEQICVTPPLEKPRT